MSVVKTQCPSCQTPLRLPEGTIGKKVRCPKCKGVFPLTADLVMAPAPAAPEEQFEEATATLSPATARGAAKPATFKVRDDEEDEAPRKKKADPPQRSAFATFFAWLLILGYLGALGAAWFGALGEFPPVPGGEIKAATVKDVKKP
jgi:LSD1 subclass zinc finger protein